MTKTYREFCNTKGEELCRSSALSHFKAGEIHGAINVAWSMEKTKLIKEEVDKVRNEIHQNCPDHLLKKFQFSMKTLERNMALVEKTERSLRLLQQELTTAKMELIDSTKSTRQFAVAKVDEIEKDLDSELAELRRAQDSLRKAINARKKLLQMLDANRNDTSSCLEEENSAEEINSASEDTEWHYSGNY